MLPKTDIKDIRLRVQSIQRLVPYISLMQAIDNGIVPSAPKRFLRDLCDDIGKILQDEELSPNLLLPATVEREIGGSKAAMQEWLINVVSTRNVKDTVVDLIGYAFDDALTACYGTLIDLPPQIKDRLRSEHVPYANICQVHFHLCTGLKPEDIDETLRERIRAIGSQEDVIQLQPRWDGIKQLMMDARWIAAFPSVPAIIESIDEVLQQLEDEGVTDFKPTVEYIIEVAIRVHDANTMGWWPKDGTDFSTDQKHDLTMGLYSVPGLLRMDMFQIQIKDTLRPFDVSLDLINQAMRQMKEEGIMHPRRVEYQAPSCSTILNDVFMFRGCAPTLSTEDDVMKTKVNSSKLSKPKTKTRKKSETAEPLIADHLKKRPHDTGEFASTASSVKPDALPTIWQDVLERLGRLRKQGEPYTSQAKLALLMGCSKATIHKAIKNSTALKAWKALAKAEKSHPRKTTHIDVATANVQQTVEPNPSTILTDEDVDMQMSKLIQQAKTEERSKLNRLDKDERRQLVETFNEQIADIEPSPLDENQHRRANPGLKQHNRI